LGPETTPIKPKRLSFKQIHAIFETLTSKMDIINPLECMPHQCRYSNPAKYLQLDAKEDLPALRQDRKR
jgi:hypothetical protein